MANEQPRYTKTERGKPKLILGGMLYTRHRTSGSKVEWRCEKRKDCSAMVTIRAETEIIKQKSHSHALDWGRCKALECIENMKEIATTSHEPTSSSIMCDK